MLRLVDKVLRIEDTSKDLFKGYRYNLAIAAHPQSIGAKIIARYYIVELSNGLSRLLLSGSPPENFMEFQRYLLDEPFFSLNSDLRWNLYMILVMPDDANRPSEQLVQSIEYDENYARKSVIRYGELQLYLQRLLFSRSIQVEGADLGTRLPSTWNEQLEAVDLDGCLESFLESNVDNYCSGGSLGAGQPVWSELSKEDEDSNARTRIEEIERISIHGFRKHCFGEKRQIQLAPVSLFFGPNGSGKTSILEAVEFAVTGSNRRLRDYKSAEEAGFASVDFIDERGERQQIDSEKTTADRKRIEKDWYGVPAGRTKCTLDQSFSRLNFLDSEAAYRFAYEDHGDPLKVLGQLLFGDKIMKMEQNLERHLKGFTDRRNDINKELKSKGEQLKLEKASLLALETKEEQGQLATLEEVIEQLEQIGMRFRQTAEVESGWNEFSRVLTILQGVSQNVEFVKEQSSQLQAFTMVDFNRKVKELSYAEDRLRMDERKLRQLKDRISEQIDMTEQQKQKHTEIKRQAKLYADTINEWKAIEHIVLGSSKAKSRRELEARKKQLEETVSLLGILMSSYPELLNWTKKDVSGVADDELEQMKEVVSLLESDKLDLIDRVDAVMAQLDAVESISTQIQALGVQLSEYIIDDKSFCQCPLCGHDHGSGKSLKTRISARQKQPITIDQGLASSLQLQVDRLEREIVKKREEIAALEQSRERGELVKEVASRLSQHSVVGLDLNAGPDEVLDKIQKVFSDADQRRTEITELVTDIVILDNQGFTLALIHEAEQFIVHNEIYRQFIESSKPRAFGGFLQEEHDWACRELEALGETILQVEHSTEVLRAKVSKEQEELEEKRVTIGCSRKQLEEFHAHLDVISSHFIVDEDTEFMKLAERILLVTRYVESALGRLEIAREAERIQASIQELETELRKLEKQYQRCSIALTNLSQAPRTRKFIDNFVNKNIRSIEDLFLRLHTPREFSGVILGESGIQLRRDDEVVDIPHTSYGQRVALAISLLLTLHLAAPDAPRFLMLDDPIAHLDDMHLLNLLDVLRELALEGHQLLITTANADLAKIFRRKFSFMGESYNEFSLVRYGKEPVRIIQRTFQYDSEESSYVEH